MAAGAMVIRRVLGLTVLSGLALCLPVAVGAYAMSSGGSAASVSVSGDLLDLNTATPEELTALPGMGPAYARRVVEGRPYSAKNQLATRGVLPASAYALIKDLIVAHRPPRRQ